MTPLATHESPTQTTLPIQVLARCDPAQFPDGSTGASMRVRDWMTRQIQTIDPNDPVSRAVDVMIEERVRHVVVSRNGALCGILSTEDLLQAAIRSQPRRLDMDLECRLMRGLLRQCHCYAVAADSLLAVAAARMGEERVSILPVLDGQRVVGVLTADDLLAALCGRSRPWR